MSVAPTTEKTIVIRDRRKPNQYTTDNLIAREWLPVLRVGDAFYFYSVYLSMANRETESSWSSLRTLAKYLQCGVDLIVRANKLLEICELVHTETGNHRTSNEYYILDPPSLTSELRARIYQRLDDIAAQETSKNWQAWVRQVRKALDRHQSLPSIWAERRAKKGGRPVRAVRPQERWQEQDAKISGNGDRDSQAGFPEKGDCDSQAGRTWDTTRARVSHGQVERESQSEQEQITKEPEQLETEETSSFLPLVQARCQHLGIAAPVVDVLLEKYSTHQICQQLEWLPFRHARDPAAMLVSAVQGNWTRPTQYNREQAQRVWVEWGEPCHKHGLRSEDDDGAGDAQTIDSEGQSSFTLPGTELDARDVWARVLEELRMQMTRATFDTWLGGTRVARVDDESIGIRVRDKYAVEWLHARWLVPIQRTLIGIIGRPVGVYFEA